MSVRRRIVMIKGEGLRATLSEKLLVQFPDIADLYLPFRLTAVSIYLPSIILISLERG